MSLYSDLNEVLTPYAQKIKDKADKSTTYTKTEVDALISEVEVETDTTLGVPGAPADAAETGRQIGLINESLEDLDTAIENIETTSPNDLQNITDIEIITYTDGVIRTSDATVDITDIIPSTTVEYAIVAVSEGDYVTINGEGENVGRAWYFADASYNRLSYSIANLVCENLICIAPANSAWLILNRKKGNNLESFKGVTVSKNISTSLIDTIQDISNNIGKSLCNYMLDYSGRIDSDGIKIYPSTNNIQRYSDWIPITANVPLNIELRVPYASGRTTWLAYSVYDTNKSVIIGRRHTTSNSPKDGYLYSKLSYTPTVDGYIRIMGDTYGDGVFVVYTSTIADAMQMPWIINNRDIVDKAVDESEAVIMPQIPDKVAELISKKSLCTLMLDYSGRIDADGLRIYGSNAAVQRYSEWIPITANIQLIFDMYVPYYAEYSLTPWMTYSIYDSEKNVVSGKARVANTNFTREGDLMHGVQTYTPTVDGYIRIQGNTYGAAMCFLRDNTTTVSLLKSLAENKEDTIADCIERTEALLMPQMRYATRYDDVCIGVNHRGYNTAPENTIPAYVESYRHGFRYVECDVKLTSDGEFVLLHDATINRTARNADGTAISETTNITDITYEQALEFDFGIYKSSEYAGTKIPLLSEFLLFCRKVGLHPYLELKFAYTEATTKAVVDMVRAHGMSGKVTYISASGSFLRAINAYEPNARLGIVTELPTSETVNLAIELKNDSNFVFIDADRATDEAVNICKQNNIPMEVWIVTANKNTILSTNPYITGFTHDYLHAGKVIYEDTMGEE